MIQKAEVSIQLTLLVLIFLIVAFIFAFFTVLNVFRMKRVLEANRNFVGKMFYILKVFLCFSRAISSMFAIYFMISQIEHLEQIFAKFILNVFYIPQVPFSIRYSPA